ncbi:MAG TPA: hypothetical protein VMC80_02075 [Patescibacteria group bacterium]|nr:hypothetical protein [Patescibacteria group bacterium]
MVDQTTIFQNVIFTNFILPFLLIFVIIYAILERTNLLGEKKHQINAIISFVIGLIFTGVLSSTKIVSNMVVFLAVTVVILFVILVLWGFIFGDKEGFKPAVWMKWVLGILAGVAFVGAVLWATGTFNSLTNILFQQSWSNSLWTNFLFVVIIVAVLFIILRGAKEKK